MYDGNDVVCEVLVWGFMFVSIQDSEFDSIPFKYPFDEFKTESTESVSVGNHNL
jgi:hypothetical protein